MTERCEVRLTSLDMTDEIGCNDDQSLEEIATDIKINTNRFHILCDNVENCFFQIDNSMFELLELKNKLLLQYLPRNVLLQITLVLSRFYRAYSQSRVPIYELIRLVQLYSEPFDMKSIVLKRLYDNNQTNKRLLNIALQKLTSTENNIKQYQEQKSINNWEKMYIRLALPRSNVRKWKFHIKTFREKAVLGYEHVIDWIHRRVPRPPSSSFEIFSNKELIDDQDIDQPEISDEIVHVQEMNEQKPPTDHSSDYDEEIGSVLSNIEKQKPIVTKIDIEVQVKPDIDDQQTSTEDILSTKFLIMRIYRPIGILKTKFQCIVHAQGQKYTTNVFNFNVFQKSNVQLTGNRTTKSIDSKTKNRSGISTIPDNIDINIIDKQQNDELLIPIPNILKRRSLFQTDIDPNTIKIDILGDDKLCGSLIFSSEDLRMLDLPNLHNLTLSPLIAINDNISIISTKNNQFDFDQISNEIYQSWISHTPHTFFIYNNKQEPIGKLPLFMFWYNKIENTHTTKCTMTDPMEIHLSIPKNEINEKIILPITDERTDDHIEILKTTYEDKIAKLHENYQAEIHRLTNLLNEIISPQINDKNTPEISNKNTRQQTKREIVIEHQSSSPPSVDKKNLPKNFLDRYQMYLQRSIIHRHQLITKIEQETALANERQMDIQHRLYRSEQNDEYDDNLCLPAVFMPFRSNNVFNPKAYQFFHSVGSAAPRLTQAPSILKFPSLPSRSVSVLNLFELSRCYDNDNEKTTNQKSHSSSRPTTQASD